MNFKDYLLGDLICIEKSTINPQKFPDIYFSHYSLPSFDNNKKPEFTRGEEIKSSKFILPEEGILFSKLNLRFKRVWKVINKKNDKTRICSSEFLPLVIKDKSILDLGYLYYFLLSDSVISLLEKASTGTSGSHQRIKVDTLLNLKISLPDIRVQREIANILSKIDNKIEINLEINEKLEEMAQGLYKYWFIDFEFPNQQGLPYKSSGGEFVDSELGPIPKGWNVKNLQDFVKSISKSIKKSEKEKAIFLNTSDILEGHFLHKTYSLTSEMPGQAKKLIQKRDILFSEIRPINKRFAYVNFDAEDYVVSTKLMVLRTDTDIFSSECLYLFLKNKNTIRELQQLAESRSGTFPQITFSELSKFNFALPNKQDFEYSYKVIGNLVNYQLNIIQENSSLKELRDTILPRLISGEIPIILEFETEVEECLRKSN